MLLSKQYIPILPKNKTVDTPKLDYPVGGGYRIHQLISEEG